MYKKITAASKISHDILVYRCIVIVVFFIDDLIDFLDTIIEEICFSSTRLSVRVWWYFLILGMKKRNPINFKMKIWLMNVYRLRYISIHLRLALLWWRQYVTTLSALLAFCEGNLLVTTLKASNSELWCFLCVSLSKLLNIQWSCWWFWTPWRPCDIIVMIYITDIF